MLFEWAVRERVVNPRTEITRLGCDYLLRTQDGVERHHAENCHVLLPKFSFERGENGKGNVNSAERGLNARANVNRARANAGHVRSGIAQIVFQ